MARRNLVATGVNDGYVAAPLVPIVKGEEFLPKL